jgi:hypothetical protein
VSLALFGAYITRAKIAVDDSSILQPEVQLSLHAVLVQLLGMSY